MTGELHGPDPSHMSQLGQLDTLFFSYEQVSTILKRMHLFLEASQCSAATNILLLKGVSGSGKSTLARYFHAAVEASAEYGPNEQIVLRVSTPSKCTIKALASHILEKLGDPLAFKGTEAELTTRVIKLIKKKKVEVMILDEFQHLIDRKSDKIAYDVAEWIKSIINELTCPVILIGLPSLQRIIDANDQLARRTLANIELRPFGFESLREQQDFCTLLALFSQKLPFKNSQAITEPEFAQKIHSSTSGTIGLVSRLLSLAGTHAIMNGSTTLQPHHFEAAIDELADDDAARPKNRFAVHAEPKKQSNSEAFERSPLLQGNPQWPL